MKIPSVAAYISFCQIHSNLVQLAVHSRNRPSFRLDLPYFIPPWQRLHAGHEVALPLRLEPFNTQEHALNPAGASGTVAK